jgi:hypothetical protein
MLIKLLSRNSAYCNLHQPARDMIHTDTMREAGVRRTRERKFGNAKLLYAPETLKLGRID